MSPKYVETQVLTSNASHNLSTLYVLENRCLNVIRPGFTYTHEDSFNYIYAYQQMDTSNPF